MWWALTLIGGIAFVLGSAAFAYYQDVLPTYLAALVVGVVVMLALPRH
jgi:hypothetical protein